MLLGQVHQERSKENQQTVVDECYECRFLVERRRIVRCDQLVHLTAEHPENNVAEQDRRVEEQFNRLHVGCTYQFDVEGGGLRRGKNR